MTERARALVSRYAIPFFLAAMAIGAAKLELEQKEDKATHALDVQRIEAKAAKDVQQLRNSDAETQALLLDVLCAVKPKDRRC